MSQFVLLTIKGACVYGCGVQDYWRAGKLDSGLQAADFGQHMVVNVNRFLAAALPYMWADKTFWHRDKRDKPWEIFMPFIEAWNDKQAALFDSYSLTVTDESMFARVPKTSKLGGLPNYTFEPRKPKPLGTMVKGTAKEIAQLAVYGDPSMTPSVQDRKPFSQSKSLLPEDAGTNNVHKVTEAETICQAYYSGMDTTSVRWMGRDAWFGSVAACLVLRNQVVTFVDDKGEEYQQPLDVESLFIIKNNVALFPRGPLLALLKATYPSTSRRAGISEPLLTVGTAKTSPTLSAQSVPPLCARSHLSTLTPTMDVTQCSTQDLRLLTSYSGLFLLLMVTTSVDKNILLWRCSGPLIVAGRSCSMVTWDSQLSTCNNCMPMSIQVLVART